jgi:Fe-S cluster biogenesis protein NfuA
MITAADCTDSSDSRHAAAERALAPIRPAMEADGGGIEVVAVEVDGTVRVRMKGTCLACPSLGLTLRHGIEATLKSRLPWVKGVIRERT